MHPKITRFNLFIVALALSVSVSAQIQDSFTLAYSKLPNTLFQSFFLHDQSSLYQVLGNYYRLKKYDGSIPAPELQPNDFQILYADLWLSQRLDSTGNRPGGKPAHLMDWKAFSKTDSTLRAKIDCPIHLLWMSYNELDSNALYEGALEFDGKFWVVPDSSIQLDQQGNYSLNRSNPYAAAEQAVLRREVFLAGTQANSFYSEQSSASINFQLPDALIQKNVGSVDAYWADFDDGNGFIQIAPNQDYIAHYGSSGSSVEWSEKFIRIRSRIGQQWREARFKVNIIFNTHPSDTSFYSSELPVPTCTVGRATFPARINIDLSDSNEVLTKPIVIVEGFEGTANPYGNLSYAAVRSGYVFDGNGERIYEHLSPLAWLMDSLNVAGFDLIYLDFYESKLPVEQNAATLMHLLQWIDSQKPDDPTTIVGASLGGLIARYALLMAENVGCCLNVAAYGTFDSPHNGAFIPIGLQATTESIARLFPNVPLFSQPWTYTLNSTAARQMLISHFDSNASGTRSEFIDVLSNRHPVNIYRFAISNGSIHGEFSALHDSAGRYLNYGWSDDVPIKHRIGAHQDTLMFNRTGQLKNVQIIGTRSEAHRGPNPYLFEGSKLSNAFRFQRMRWISISNAFKAQFIYTLGNIASFIPSSIVNGAVEAIQTQTNLKLNHLMILTSQQGNKALKTKYPNDYDEIPGSLTDTPASFDYPFITVYSPEHSFIPAFSALDAGDKYDTSVVPIHSGILPFNSIYAPGLSDTSVFNQKHIETTPEIITYLLEQLNGIYRTAPSTINDTFNIAQAQYLRSPYLKQIGDFQITANASLRLGFQGPIGFANSTAIADSIQYLQISLKNGCKAGNVDVYGAIEIGESTKRKAELRIARGTSLVLNSNSKLIIGPSSSLIIESGGRLVIKKGATITLNEGEINANGILELMQGASFEPKGQGTIYGGDDIEFLLHSENAIKIENHRVVLKGQFNIPGELLLFTMDRCDVELKDGGGLFCSAPLELRNSAFNQSVQKQWSGVRALGASVVVEQCEFSGGSPALELAANVHAAVRRSKFTDCNVGTLISNRLDHFTNNSFDRCRLGAGLQVEQSDIIGCRFQNCFDGLLVESDGGSTYLEKCMFNSNQHIGLEARNASVRLSCSHFLSNGDAFVSSGSTIQIARNAGNLFQGNFTAIKAVQCTGLELSQGHNRFVLNQAFDLLCNFDSTAILTKSGGFYQIPANYNSFSSPSSTELIKDRTPVYLSYNPQLAVSNRLCPELSRVATDSSANSPKASAALLVWPNPSDNGKGNIRLPHDEGGTIYLRNLAGQSIQIIQVEQGTQELGIDIGSYRGLCIVQFESKESVAIFRWILPR